MSGWGWDALLGLYMGGGRSPIEWHNEDNLEVSHQLLACTILSVS